jgi:hypothetical protein
MEEVRIINIDDASRMMVNMVLAADSFWHFELLSSQAFVNINTHLSPHIERT